MQLQRVHMSHVRMITLVLGTVPAAVFVLKVNYFRSECLCGSM